MDLRAGLNFASFPWLELHFCSSCRRYPNETRHFAPQVGHLKLTVGGYVEEKGKRTFDGVVSATGAATVRCLFIGGDFAYLRSSVDMSDSQ